MNVFFQRSGPNGGSGSSRQAGEVNRWSECQESVTSPWYQATLWLRWQRRMFRTYVWGQENTCIERGTICILLRVDTGIVSGVLPSFLLCMLFLIVP